MVIRTALVVALALSTCSVQCLRPVSQATSSLRRTHLVRHSNFDRVFRDNTPDDFSGDDFGSDDFGEPLEDVQMNAGGTRLAHMMGKVDVNAMRPKRAPSTSTEATEFDAEIVEDGYDPSDENSVQAWRQLKRQQARERMERLSKKQAIDETSSDRQINEGVGEWDNDDYMSSLKRPPEELRQEWEKPTKRLWKNDDWVPEYLNSANSEEFAAVLREQQEAREVRMEIQKEEIQGKLAAQLLSDDTSEVSRKRGPSSATGSYAEQLAQARAAKAAMDTAPTPAPVPAPVAAAPTTAPLAAQVDSAGGSFLTNFLVETDGDLVALRERLSGALSMVDGMLALQKLQEERSSAGAATQPPSPSPPPPPAAEAATNTAPPPVEVETDASEAEEVPEGTPIDEATQQAMREAEERASGDGFDPADEESMKAWRRQKAQEARERMMERMAAAETAAPSTGPEPLVAATEAETESASETDPEVEAEAEEKPNEAQQTLPLNKDQESRLRAAVGLLIKHRGGGPFGAGRLPLEEVGGLERALVDLVNVLREDSAAAGLAAADPEVARMAQRQAGEGMLPDSEKPIESEREFDPVVTVPKEDATKRPAPQRTMSYKEQLEAAREKKRQGNK